MAHRFTLALATAVASLGFAAPAMANPFWAAPSAVALGNCSDAANACDLPTAVGDATTNGDEIILTPGTYTVGTLLNNTHQISIHGEDGEARPVVDGTMSIGSLFSLTGGATLRDLEIDLTGTANGAAIELAGTGSLQDVIVNATGPNSLAGIFVDQASSYTMRDTVVLTSSSGEPTSAIWTDSPLTLRSVTAIGTTTFSRGLSMSNIDDTTAVTVDAKNVILRGAQFDVIQFASTHTAPGNTLNIDYSNYRPDKLFSDNDGNVFNAGAHNQTTVDPVFEADGYHEAAGSPTIGAGFSDAAAPPFDLDGDLRYVGAMDIGADQFPLAASAQAIGQTGAGSDACTPPGNGYALTQSFIQGLPSYTAQADGVITSWSTWVGAVDMNTVAELKVWDPATHTVRVQSPIETGLTPNSENTFTASPGITIHAGDTVAVGVPTGKTVYCQFTTALGNDDIEARTGATGDPQPGESTNTGGGGGNLRVNLQAYVEPDADHDGYGDLTQDGCPTDASTHGPCPVPTGPGGGGGGGGGGGSGTQPNGTGQTVGGGTTHFKGARLASRRLRVVGRFALVNERCDRACTGTATLTAVLTSSNKHRAVVLGRARFRTHGSGTAQMKIKLSKRALAALRKHGHLTATLKTGSRDQTGDRASSAARVTLKLVRSRRRGH